MFLSTIICTGCSKVHLQTPESFCEIQGGYCIKDSSLYKIRDKVSPSVMVLDESIIGQVDSHCDDDAYILLHQLHDTDCTASRCTCNVDAKSCSSVKVRDKLLMAHDCYWIVRKKDGKLFGPLDKSEFMAQCYKMKVKCTLDRYSSFIGNTHSMSCYNYRQ